MRNKGITTIKLIVIICIVIVIAVIGYTLYAGSKSNLAGTTDNYVNTTLGSDIYMDVGYNDALEYTYEDLVKVGLVNGRYGLTGRSDGGSGDGDEDGEDEEEEEEEEEEDENYSGTAASIQDMCDLLPGAQTELGLSNFSVPTSFTAKEQDILVALRATGMSNPAVCGIIGNSNSEGGFGLQQYNKTTQLGKSTPSSPIYVYNYSFDTTLSALCALYRSGNSIGIGITQWTYYTYFNINGGDNSYTWNLNNHKDYWDVDKKACIMYIELKMIQISGAGIEAHAADTSTLPIYDNKSATWTWDQLYSGCGATTEQEKKAARAAAWYLWLHERCQNYRNLSIAVGRATKAVDALRRMSSG